MRRLSLVVPLVLATLLSCKRKDEVRKDDVRAASVRLVYRAVVPPDVADHVAVVERTRQTVRRRIEAFRIAGVRVAGAGDEVVLDFDQGAVSELGNLDVALTREGRLEFVLLTDDDDAVGSIDLAVHPLPRGATIQNELAPIGLSPDGQVKQAGVHFVRLVKQPSESLDEASARLGQWLMDSTTPGHAFLPGFASDPQTGEELREAIRSYGAAPHADLDDSALSDAQASIDRSRPDQLYYVALTFTPEGTERFRALTAANVKRRFAIVLDGWVNSAPVIQTEIRGGHASLTLGPHSTEAEARSLAGILRIHRLPAKLTFVSKNKL